MTGQKWKDKTYYRHTGYVGGLKQASAEEMLARHPEEIIRKAVKGMLARGPLGRAQLKKLKVYTGVDHPHTKSVFRPPSLCCMCAIYFMTLLGHGKIVHHY